jgi:hypothetical protein
MDPEGRVSKPVAYNSCNVSPAKDEAYREARTQRSLSEATIAGDRAFLDLNCLGIPEPFAVSGFRRRLIACPQSVVVLNVIFCTAGAGMIASLVRKRVVMAARLGRTMCASFWAMSIMHGYIMCTVLEAYKFRCF